MISSSARHDGKSATLKRTFILRMKTMGFVKDDGGDEQKEANTFVLAHTQL
jgi:hypothetical protein